MKTTTVQLPDFCERHGKHCSYTGLETDRCSLCHSSLHKTDDHGDPWDGGKKRPCQCAGCGEYFTSTSAFGHHQRPKSGQLCHDPAKYGLVLVKIGEWTMWGWPGDQPEGIHAG